MRTASPFLDGSTAEPAAAPTGRPPPLRHWRLTRGCAITPRAYMLHLCAIVLVLLGAAAAMAAIGSIGLSAALLLQALLVVGGGLFYAVHVADGEQVLLYPDRLVVRLHRGLKTRSYSFNPCWAHFECGRGPDAGYYWLRYGEIRLPLGHHLEPIPRCQAVAEITSALLACHRWDPE